MFAAQLRSDADRSTMRKLVLLVLTGALLSACGSSGSHKTVPRVATPADYCTAVAAFQQERVAQEGKGTVDLSEQHVAAVAAKFVEVDAAAPAAVKADTAYVRQGFADEAAAVKGTGNDMDKALAALSKMNATVDHKRAHAAAEHIAAATKAQCHVVFDVSASEKSVTEQLDDPTGCYSDDDKICS
jgi:hypothetical protein